MGTHDPYASLQQLLLAGNLGGCEQMWTDGCVSFLFGWSEACWNRLKGLVHKLLGPNLSWNTSSWLHCVSELGALKPICFLTGRFGSSLMLRHPQIHLWSSSSFVETIRSSGCRSLGESQRFGASSNEECWRLETTESNLYPFVEIVRVKMFEQKTDAFMIYMLYIYIWSDKIRTLWGVVLPFLVYLGKSSIWIRIGSYKYCYEL